MKIRVEGLSDAAVHLSAVEPVSDYPALVELQQSGDCVFIEPLRLDFTIAREFDHVRVNGRVATGVRLSCSRCLKNFVTGLLAEFTVFYSKFSKVPLDEDVSLSDEDLISAEYDGDEIDFAREIEEQVLMEIPYKPLCDDGCKGLCATCGADLNSGDCGCGSSGAGFKFSALKNFTVKQ
jgi:uncharacterized protein